MRNGEAAGGGSPAAGESEGEESANARTERARTSWSEPLGEGSRGGRQKHGGGPLHWSIRGKWPNRVPGLVEPRHTRKVGAGLVPLERGYKRKRPQGRAESIRRGGSEHSGKNGGERDGE